MLLINHWYTITLIIALRYFIIAGLAYWVWYVLLKNKIAFKKIQLRFPASKDYQREILYSSITIIIFATVPYFLLNPPLKQFTLFYQGVATHGWLWFGLAFPLMLLLHDAYFYFTHRLMHHRLGQHLHFIL
jgi:Delta7-sterol 5-desaturase